LNYLNDATQLENALKAMGMLVDSVATQAIDFANAEGESALQAKSLVDDMSRAEMAHIQTQNALLVQLVEAEKVKSARANDELVARISGLLGELVASRDQELREAFSAVTKANTKHEEEFSKFGQRHERLMNEIAVRGSDTMTSMERRGAEGKRTRDGALKVRVSTREDLCALIEGPQVVGSVQAAFRDGLSAMHNSMATATTTYTGELQRQSQTLQTSFGGGK